MRRQRHAALQRGADHLFPPGFLEHAGHFLPQCGQPFPRRSGVGVPRCVVQGLETRQVHGLFLRPGSGPDLLGREGEHRGRERRDGASDPVHDRLRRTPLPRRRGRGVQPVLDDVEVEGRERRGAEVDEGVVHDVELIALVGFADPRRQGPGLAQDPSVERQEAGHRDRVPGRVEVVEVRQQVAHGVANLAIGLPAPRQDLVGDRVVVAVIEARDPEAQDVGAVFRDEVLRPQGVAERLGHLPRLDVEREAVSDDAFVGSLSEERHGGQKRRLEPPPVLVVPLDIEVRGRPVRRRASVPATRPTAGPPGATRPSRTRHRGCPSLSGTR